MSTDGREPGPREKAVDEFRRRVGQHEADEKNAAAGDEGGDADTDEKTWVPYTGPAGGEGWQNATTGEVVYQEEAPGPTADDPGAGDEAAVDATDRNAVTEVMTEGVGLDEQTAYSVAYDLSEAADDGGLTRDDVEVYAGRALDDEQIDTLSGLLGASKAAENTEPMTEDDTNEKAEEDRTETTTEKAIEAFREKLSDEGADDPVRAFHEKLAEKGIVEKTWVPYTGPQGGEGWRNLESGDVVYQQEPPGATPDTDDISDEDLEAYAEAEGIDAGPDEIRDALRDALEGREGDATETDAEHPGDPDRLAGRLEHAGLDPEVAQTVATESADLADEDGWVDRDDLRDLMVEAGASEDEANDAAEDLMALSEQFNIGGDPITGGYGTPEDEGDDEDGPAEDGPAGAADAAAQQMADAAGDDLIMAWGAATMQPNDQAPDDPVDMAKEIIEADPMMASNYVDTDPDGDQAYMEGTSRAADEGVTDEYMNALTEEFENEGFEDAMLEGPAAFEFAAGLAPDAVERANDRVFGDDEDGPDTDDDGGDGGDDYDYPESIDADEAAQQLEDFGYEPHVAREVAFQLSHVDRPHSGDVRDAVDVAGPGGHDAMLMADQITAELGLPQEGWVMDEEDQPRPSDELPEPGSPAWGDDYGPEDFEEAISGAWGFNEAVNAVQGTLGDGPMEEFQERVEAAAQQQWGIAPPDPNDFQEYQEWTEQVQEFGIMDEVVDEFVEHYSGTTESADFGSPDQKARRFVESQRRKLSDESAVSPEEAARKHRERADELFGTGDEE